MGLSSPSHYNSIEMDRLKTSSPKFDWKISKTVRISPLKKTAAGQPEVSPSSYKNDAAKDKIGAKAIAFTYSKDKKKSFVARYEAQKKFLPSPCAYNVDAAYSKITIGARKGYK